MSGKKWQGNNNPGHQRRMAMWRAIEEEFGEPIRDVISGMRLLGYSWRTIAGALGVCRVTIIEWRHALGLPVGDNKVIRDVLPPRPSDLQAQRLGYPDAPAAIADLRIVHGLGIHEVGRRLGLHPTTVSTLSPPHIRGVRYGRHAA